MREEIESLYKNNTWILVRKLGKKKVVGCKWVYKITHGITREEQKRFKTCKMIYSEREH